MNNYGKIKQLLNQANKLAAEGKLDEADACVRKTLPLGASQHDITTNLSQQTRRKLREHTSQ